MLQKRARSRGFTLLEILLVIAVIAILAAIVLVAINPLQQLADSRDTQRRADVNTLSNAIVQYSIKAGSNISLPTASGCSGLSYTSAYGICALGQTCAGIELDDYLVPDYIAGIPQDPSVETTTTFSGYTAFRLANGRAVVCAPETEGAELISVTR